MYGVSNPAVGVDITLWYILGISIVLLTLITATMIWFVIRYRRDKHPDPVDIRGNWILETVWMLVPTLIALSMFVIGWQSYIGLREVPDDAIEIEVYAQMYSWIFVYPNDKETENELVVPVNSAVKLNITSEDVLHSFYLPAFRIKVDAVKGLDTYAWFQADKLGVFDIHCTEFCGIGHYDMNAVLTIVPQDDYLEWLETDEDDE